MGGTSITERTLVFLLTAALCSRATLVYDLHFTDPMTWAEARQQCQASSSDLVTFHALNVLNNYNFIKNDVWIGLQRDHSDLAWRWINLETGYGTEGENVSSSRNWVSYTQSKWSAGFNCGSLEPSSGRFFGDVCMTQKEALCSGDNLLLVNERKTWEEAVRHCRDMEVACDSLEGACRRHYDLVSLSDTSDSGYAKVKIVNATTDEVWVGLRFLKGEWWWLDGAEVDVEHQNLLPDCPPRQRHCGTLSKDKETTTLLIRDCSERKSFICAGIY